MQSFLISTPIFHTISLLHQMTFHELDLKSPWWHIVKIWLPETRFHVFWQRFIQYASIFN